MTDAAIQQRETTVPDTTRSADEKPPLLFLCHRIPYPPNKGDKIRAFHLLRYLSLRFDIHLACFVDDPEDWSGAAELEPYCRETFFRPLKSGTAKLRSLSGLLSHKALSLPYYADSVMKRWVARTCAAHDIRHTLVYSSAMAQFLPEGGPDVQRRVIDFVDVDSDKWRQYATQKPWPMSWLYRREARLLLRCERELAARFDASLFVSCAEATLFRDLSPETAHKTGFYNNGVDFSYFDPHSSAARALQNPYPAGCQALVFTGAMDYWPNADAVSWFAHTVLPVLRDEHPALDFYIVGSNPATNVQRLARLPGVTVTGRVPDVRPYLKYGLATVAPMRVARGVQNKVLEGMAMALPVLVSRKGLEGIDAQHGEHVLLANSVDEYSSGISDVLAGRHPELGNRARARVKQVFDWQQTLPKVVELLTQPAARVTAAEASAPVMPIAGSKMLMTLLGLYCLLLALVFHDTLLSIVAIWQRSETFAHGFLILPISLWMAWRMRDRFSGLSVRPEPRALLLVSGTGLVWLLANMVDVLVVQQLAFVAMLVSGIWAIVGNAVVRCYAFPLGFLFLAVPMGEGLIPPLMELTADSTEFLVRASGVPVFREGMYLYLPTGTWSVIEECSGVRYLIASVTLGLCYAHLTYNSLWRQAVFIAFAIIMPILANSARAYAVVMVGHLSDMRFGIGADHLVFGWIFFGVVMLLMFWVGGFWREEEPSTAPASGPATSSRSAPVRPVALVTALAMACVGVWPAVSLSMNRNTGPVDTAALTLPATLHHWRAVDGQDWAWHPAQPGADRELDQVYVASTSPEPVTVAVHLRQYLQQRQGTELVDNNDPWRPDRTVWRVIERQRTGISLDRPADVDEARVVSARQHLLVWSWYHVDGRNTANPYLVKLLEARQQIVEGRRQGTRLFIATPMVEDISQARSVLQDFVNDNRAAIEASLDRGITSPGNDGSGTPPTGAEE
ncbi:MAG: exosortase A [Pseudohongiellaceae bacterium]